MKIIQLILNTIFHTKAAVFSFAGCYYPTFILKSTACILPCYLGLENECYILAIRQIHIPLQRSLLMVIPYCNRYWIMLYTFISSMLYDTSNRVTIAKIS
uniref:Uncharacterized protein n=1 Tax=Schistocephalus solidus TaxID=70667 RepID=A0A0X3NZ50_SCHSO